MSRRDELAAGLAGVDARVRRVCAVSAREPSEITVVVVTKGFPDSDVRLLAQLGVRDIGESRDQEAVAKAAQCADLDLRWHFVGQVQTNKAASVARYASVVHSVDRPRLVDALDRAAAAAGRALHCLVQVSLDQSRAAGSHRAGAAPDQTVALADRVAAAPSLHLAGVMAVAPRRGDPNDAFAVLADVAAEVRKRHPSANWVSAGMSADLEAAVVHGATHLRVGSAILGARPRRV